MLKPPLVSILIPVYNRAGLIRSCITSAIAQTWENVEIIVVDNASSDNTWDICQDLAAADNRIRLFRNVDNIGPVLNWQRCIDEARGEFGKILFSDDTIESNCLETLLPYMSNPDVGFAFSAVKVLSCNGLATAVYRWSKSSGIFSSARFIEGSLFGADLPVSPGAGLFRLKDLRENLTLNIPSPLLLDFQGVGGGVDLLLYLLTAKKYRSVAFSPLCLSCFQDHGSSISKVLNRDGRLSDYYRQAKVHFAYTYLSRLELNSLLLYIWYLNVRAERSKSSFITIERKYLSTSVGLNLIRLTAAAINLARLKILMKIRQD